MWDPRRMCMATITADSAGTNKWVQKIIHNRIRIISSPIPECGCIHQQIMEHGVVKNIRVIDGGGVSPDAVP